MRKFTYSITAPFAILFVSLFGCNKSDSNSTSAKVKLLTSAPWIMVAEQQRRSSFPTWTDSYAALQPCEKDDRYVFNVNGAYENNEGPSKCSASDPQIIETGAWAMTAAETGFTLIIGGQQKNVTIETLNETTLSVSFVTSIVGYSFDVKETFTHL